MQIEMYCPVCGTTSDLDEDILVSPGNFWITCSHCGAHFRAEIQFYEEA